MTVWVPRAAARRAHPGRRPAPWMGLVWSVAGRRTVGGMEAVGRYGNGDLGQAQSGMLAPRAGSPMFRPVRFRKAPLVR